MIFTPLKFSLNENNGLQFSTWFGNMGSGAKDAAEQIQKDVQALTEFQVVAKETKNPIQAMAQTLSGASQTARDYAKNLVGTNATGSVEQYATAQVAASKAITKVGTSSKLAAVGVGILNTALNAGIWIAVSYGISLAIKGIENWVNAQQNAIDAAEELNNTYKTNIETSSSNISTLEGLEEKFDTLSKGVDKYGNNVALSADEYKEYKSIVEQVVGISPTLQTGYNKEGEAIANNNGLIQKAIDLEKEKIRVEQQSLVSDDKLWTSAQGTIGSYQKQLESIKSTSDNFISSVNKMTNISIWGGNESQNLPKIKSIAKVIGIDTSSDNTNFQASTFVTTYSKQIQANAKKVYQAMLNDTKTFSEDDIEVFKNYLDNKANMSSSLEKISKEFNTTLQVIPQTLTSYENLTDTEKNFITDYVNGFSEADINTKEKLTDVKQNIQKLTNNIASNTDLQNAITKLFALDKTKISASTYQTQLNNLLKKIATILNMPENQLKIQLGFDTDDTNITTMLNTLKQKLTGSDNDIQKYIKSLDFSDLKIAYKIVNDSTDGMSLDALIQKIKNVKKEASNSSDLTSSFETLSSEIDTATSKISAYASNIKDLNSAIDTQNKGNLLTGEQVSTLIGKYPQLTNKITETTNGYKFQEGALEDVRKAQIQEQETAINAAIADAQNTIDSVEKQINSYSDLIGTIKTVADAKAALANLDNESQVTGPSQTGQKKFALNEYIENQTKIDEYKDKIAALKEQENLVGTNNYSSTNQSSSNSAESATKKAAESLKEEYEAQLKVIEANNELGNYKSDKYGVEGLQYYQDLLALYNKWKNTSLDSDEKLSLQEKVLSAHKSYEQSIWDVSKQELQTRINLNQVQEGSVEQIQNLLQLQKLLNSSAMTLVNTKENQLEIEKEIYNAKKQYEENNYTNSLDELQGRLDNGSIRSGSKEELQNLQEIYSNLTTNPNMQKANTEERQKEMLQKIYENKKQALENDLSDIEAQEQLGILQSGSVTSISKLQQLKKQIINSDLNAIDKEEQLQAVQEQINSEIQTYNENQINAVDHLVNIGKLQGNSLEYIQRLNRLYKTLNLTLEERQSLQEKIFSAEKSYIEQLKSDLTDEYLEGSYGYREKQIQDQIDALNEENEAYSKQIALEKAKAELEEAQNQKSIQIYREGQGFVFETDQDTITEKKQAVADAEREERIEKLTEQKEKLEDEAEEMTSKLEAALRELDGSNETTWSDIQDEISDVIDNVNAVFKNHTTTTVSCYSEIDDALDDSTSNTVEDYESQIEAANDFVEQMNEITPQILTINQTIADSNNKVAESYQAIAAALLRTAYEYSDLENNRERANDRYNAYNEEARAEHKTVKYASGTRYVPKTDIYNVDELGSELIIRAPQQGDLTSLSVGDAVVPNDLTNKLFALANNATTILSNNLGVPSMPKISVSMPNVGSDNAGGVTQMEFNNSKFEISGAEDALGMLNQLSNLELDAQKRFMKS